MSPWQVSFGVSIAVLLPVAYGVTAELAYMAGYWPLLWGYFGIHLVFVPAMVWAGVVFGVYSLARMLVLGDVGSRITVLDKTIRQGRSLSGSTLPAAGRVFVQDGAVFVVVRTRGGRLWRGASAPTAPAE